MCNNELYHHGILGQKWGVRRFQNEDGSLTSAGRKRYNDDSDAVAYAHAKKIESLYNLNQKKEAAEKVLYTNPKRFNGTKERKEYIDAINNADIAFKRAQKTMAPLLKQYADIKVDMLTENKTGESYVRSILTSKTGETYISEFYLGIQVK